jgi:hypothetical protein
MRIAVEDGLIKSVPKIRLLKIDLSQMSMGPALTPEEYKRILKTVDAVRPKQEKNWK